MNLKEYLFYKKLTAKEFAKILDIDKCYISSVISGNRKPSKKLLRSIEKYTDGIVKSENAFSETKLPKEFLSIKQD
jgi:transcriptional regulator with XRE-family HTH domain